MATKKKAAKKQPVSKPAKKMPAKKKVAKKAIAKRTATSLVKTPRATRKTKITATPKTKPPRGSSTANLDLFAPCRVHTSDDGTHSLMLTDFDATAEVFADAGWEGGGYDWQAVVDALMRMRAADLANELEYDPEASMFVAFSANRAAIEAAAQSIRAAIEDPDLLRTAIAQADPDLID